MVRLMPLESVEISVKKRHKPETKIAFLEDENIYIEPLDKDVMNDIKL